MKNDVHAVLNKLEGNRMAVQPQEYNSSDKRYQTDK